MDIIEGLKTWGFEIFGVSLILYALIRFIKRVSQGALGSDDLLLYIIAACIGFLFMTHKNVGHHLSSLKPKEKSKRITEDKNKDVGHQE